MTTLSLALLAAFALVQTPPANLLTNGDARQRSAGWHTQDVAITEQIDDVPCFTVRWRGSFMQEVALPPTVAGMYAAIVGRGQAERVNAGPSITGLPYLYGMVIAANRRYLAYWQGQRMLARPESPGQWVPMSGVFRVPSDAMAVSVWLRQAEYKDDPQDGSAARFADVRMVLFASEDAAQAYVSAYR